MCQALRGSPISVHHHRGQCYLRTPRLSAPIIRSNPPPNTETQPNFSITQDHDPAWGSSMLPEKLLRVPARIRLQALTPFFLRSMYFSKPASTYPFSVPSRCIVSNPEHLSKDLGTQPLKCDHQEGEAPPPDAAGGSEPVSRRLA